MGWDRKKEKGDSAKQPAKRSSQRMRLQPLQCSRQPHLGQKEARSCGKTVRGSKKGKEGKMEKGTTLACPWVRAVLCLRGCTLQSGLHPFPIGLVDAVLQQTLDERCPLAMETGRR